MPFSTPIFKQETLDFLKSKYDSSAKILDLGAGCGTYSDLMRSIFPNMDAVEIHAPYIEEYQLRDKYNFVWNDNAITFDFDYYDVIILGDILEHIEESEGIKLIERLYNKCNDLIIGIPYNSEQGIHFDNIYEIHLQDKLTNESFLEKYKGFRPLGLRYDYGVYIKNNKENQKVKVAYDIYEEKMISHYDDNLEPVYLTTKDSNLTVVTGLWNINRPGRDFNQYLEQFEKLLDVDCNLFIFIPQEYEHIVWKKRKKHNTSVKVFELEDIKTLYGGFWDKTQRIRTNPDWYNQTGEGGWLKGSPQAILEWYNPIVMSKYSLLHTVSCWDPFKSEYFMWLDAGITFTVYEKFFLEPGFFDKLIPYFDPFLFLSYPYEANDEVHGFEHTEMARLAGSKIKYVCRGGLFGGTKEAINIGNGTYWYYLNKTLSSGYMGTEESIFTIMSYKEPDFYRRYSLDENGLVVKFVQAVINGNVELEKLPESKHKRKNIVTREKVNSVKTNLYILTFNFPEQLQYTIDSMKKVPEWLEKPHLVLLDNSTDDKAQEKNKEIAKEYNFEYIWLEGNTGICGGRQKAAEHFHESDADYYFFFEDDMTSNPPELEGSYCRNGLRKYVPNLYEILHKIMIKEDFDFLKVSFTEVYWDNNIQTAWYNVPQDIRTRDWPDYDQLPATGTDPNAPRTVFNTIDVVDNVAYISGEITYTNWPMIVSKKGNQKMFIDTKWEFPYEQTWMSHMYQENKKGNIKPAVLLASPIWHERIKYYKPEERREN